MRVSALRLGAGQTPGGVLGADEDSGGPASLLLRLPRLLRH